MICCTLLAAETRAPNVVLYRFLFFFFFISSYVPFAMALKCEISSDAFYVFVFLWLRVYARVRAPSFNCNSFGQNANERTLNSYIRIWEGSQSFSQHRKALIKTVAIQNWQSNNSKTKQWNKVTKIMVLAIIIAIKSFCLVIEREIAAYKNQFKFSKQQNENIQSSNQQQQQ